MTRRRNSSIHSIAEGVRPNRRRSVKFAKVQKTETLSEARNGRASGLIETVGDSIPEFI